MLNPRLITTSVVRGSNQGESHGGVYLVDLESQVVEQKLDWNTVDIDWQGRGWDRGLRGIAFHDGLVYIAASDELFAYTPDFKLVDSWRCPALKHCHEIAVWEDHLFLTSTGFDSILGFNLANKTFDWALHIQIDKFRYKASRYNPMVEAESPLQLNKLHINMVSCHKGGMYLSGLKTGGMLHFNGEHVRMAATLPAGTHNAQPFRNGVLFNDTASDRISYSARDGEEDRSVPVPKYDPSELTFKNLDNQQLARQGFARGLCVMSERLVAGGSSPSTITLYDLKDSRQLMSVQLTKDIRNAIHGLELWPY